MLETINLDTLIPSITQWIGINLLTQNTLYQSILILAAIIIGGLTYRLIRTKLKATITAAPLPPPAQNILQNLAQLTFPFLTLITLFIGIHIAQADPLTLQTTLAEAIAKVIFAWIIIRAIVQFIGNRAMRNFCAFTIWTIAALSIFGILDQTMSTLDTLAFSIGDFRLSALAVIKSILLIFALLYFALFSATFTEQKISTIKSLSRSSQVLISKIMRVTLIVFALLIGITSAGIDLSLFAVFGGAIGLGIGFGLQKGISNLFSGMLLLMDRSIKPGDVIEIPDIGTFGWVNNMAARYTEIVTRDNKSFLIPNEDFITQRVVNWSHGNSLIRVQIAFGVHYDSDMEEVIKIAIEAAKKPDRVVEIRDPVCWMTEFGDSSVNFSLRFW
ncbi:MAG: mechanosensitive ion channel family protein, partial [Alphaproteobacteria bacterium]